MVIFQCDFLTCKFIVCMIVSEKIFVAYMDQSFVSTHDIGANQTFQITFPVNNDLQDGFSLILNNLGVEFSVSLGLPKKGVLLNDFRHLFLFIIFRPY